MQNQTQNIFDIQDLSRKQLFLIGGGVLLTVVLVISGVIWFTSGDDGEDAGRQAQIGIVSRTIEQECANAENYEKCIARRSTQRAELTGDLSVCDGLDGAERENCIWMAAENALNPDYCTNILSEDVRQKCQDGVNYSLAEERGDRSACERIEDEDKRSNCERSLRREVTPENCSEVFPEMTDYCQQWQQAKDLVLAGEASEEVCQNEITNPSANARCFEMLDYHDFDSDGLRASTENAFGSDPLVADTDGDGLRDDRERELETDPTQADSDGDGLTDGEEVDEYASNPLRADTDRDGFSDGEEVESGYNPAGPGQL